MSNPLLSNSKLPLFSAIQPKHVEPAIDQLLAQARATVKNCLQATDEYNYDNLIAPIEEAEDRLNKAWAPVSHINAVNNNEALRHAYNACLPKLSDYATEMGQHQGLFKAYLKIAEDSRFADLDKARQKNIRNALRAFQLSGVALDEAQKQRFKTLCLELSDCASRFEENVLDATNVWQKHITDCNDLAGLPESALAQAAQYAQQQGMQGWLLSLQYPSYIAVMTYAESRDLRREMYHAYSTRASDPGASAYDNSEIMEKILSLRHEKAQLLGFANYAELSLATKMADNPAQVIDFLEDLANKSWRQARKDLAELRSFAGQEYGVNDLQSWDMSFYSEKMRQHAYQLSQEQVKAYFPITKVLPGLFHIVEKLYGISITEISDFDSWHKDARFFAIHDATGELRGQFYLDLYARNHKRGGAWMDDCVGRKKNHDGLQTPVAFLVCNFTPPIDNVPALLTHDEVTTLFHEFGHGLQHLLTRVDCLGVSGINGVEWDAVELPSQFMENWCWQPEGLALISGHYQTNEALPPDLLTKMLAAKNFQSALAMLRQLEFSLFDFRLHQDYDPKKGARIYPILDQVRAQVSVMQPPAFNRFAHSFGHIFAGGYAAGYYSYKWAEVLSSDAFSLFEEKGIFDSATSLAFLHAILESGGSEDAMQLFIKFRGRKPSIDALLRHNGIDA